MSCSFYLDDFRDVRQVAIQLLFHGALFSGFVKYSYVLPIKLLYAFSLRPTGVSIQ